MHRFEYRRYEWLQVRIFGDRETLARCAAYDVAQVLRGVLAERGGARLVLATGASQFAFLTALRQTSIDWSRVTVFHLDEYAGMGPEHPASFRRYLRERILDHVRPGRVHFLEGEAPDLAAVCARYEGLLHEAPIDVACIGIGENGHLAFNDPPVADFADPLWVKVVELDAACRRQQSGEGWFARIEDVPARALSMTIPAILQARFISCVVPDARKAAAVRKALLGPVATCCPASILRRAPQAVLNLDPPAASQLD